MGSRAASGLRAALLALAAAVTAAGTAAGLALCGCTGSAGPAAGNWGSSASRAAPAPAATLFGRAVLTGRVPGGGRPLIIGVVRDGTVLATARVTPGGRFAFTVPAGRSEIAVWLPGARPGPSNAICHETVVAAARRRTVANLTCVWH